MNSDSDSTQIVYLNGKFIPLNQAHISVLDRGFIFGDGVYEVIPIYNKKPFLIDEHLARLDRSLGRTRINAGFKHSDWIDLIAELLDKFNGVNGLVYLQVTRGVAKREHGFPKPEIKPTIFMMVNSANFPGDELRNNGISAIRKQDERWLMCDIKSTSLLGNVLAKQYATDNSANEVIQFRDGFMTEGSSSNVWLAKDGNLIRPKSDTRILKGIRYSFIAELAKENNINLITKDISEDEINEADEIMVSSASKEILAVTRYNNKIVGDGKPGKIFALLRKSYDSHIERVTK